MSTIGHCTCTYINLLIIPTKPDKQTDVTYVPPFLSNQRRESRISCVNYFNLRLICNIYRSYVFVWVYFENYYFWNNFFASRTATLEMTGIKICMTRTGIWTMHSCTWSMRKWCLKLCWVPFFDSGSESWNTFNGLRELYLPLRY